MPVETKIESGLTLHETVKERYGNDLEDVYEYLYVNDKHDLVLWLMELTSASDEATEELIKEVKDNREEMENA